MEMSKDSLKQQQYEGTRRKKITDEIYDFIRKMAAGAKTLKIQEIKERYKQKFNYRNLMGGQFNKFNFIIKLVVS